MPQKFLVKEENIQVFENIGNVFLVLIRIRWIGTGSHPYEKTMSSIVFYPAFYGI